MNLNWPSTYYVLCPKTYTLAALEMCHNPRLSSRQVARSARICETGLLSNACRVWFIVKYHNNICSYFFFIHAEIEMCLSCAVLTRLSLVPHICASELGQHWSRQWLVTSSVPSCYLNQHWFIVKWTLRTKLQWNLNRTKYNFFVHGKAIENIDCEIEGILFRRRWINGEI